jgi:hypothetical protein
MKKKLGLLVIPCLAFLSVGPVSSAGAAADPPAQPNDTCFGKRPTIINFFYDGQRKARIFQGTAGDDVIIGTDAADIVWGNGGNDTICTRAGTDHVYYDADTGTRTQVDLGPGDDTVFPNTEGWGRLDAFGGPGNDDLWGSWGDDTLVAQAGASFDIYAGYGSDICDAEHGPGNSVALNCETFNLGWEPATPIVNYVRWTKPATQPTQPPTTTTRPATTATTSR